MFCLHLAGLVENSSHEKPIAEEGEQCADADDDALVGGDDDQGDEGLIHSRPPLDRIRPSASRHAARTDVRNSSSAPALDDLLADPVRALSLARAEAARLLVQVGGLEAVLRARVASPGQNSGQPTSALWTVEQVAEYLVLRPS